jgi:hypothetical protein
MAGWDRFGWDRFLRERDKPRQVGFGFRPGVLAIVVCNAALRAGAPE